MIGQSVINVKSGGRTRISGVSAALFLLSFILFTSGLIEQGFARRPYWRDVHGGDRYLRLEELDHHAPHSA